MSRLLSFTSLCLAIAVSGCGGDGPKLYPVTGKVTIDGSPKGKLSVVFTPVKGGMGAVGVTNDKGEYILQTNGKRGAIEGDHKVSITTIFDPPPAPKVDGNAPSGGDAYMNQANIKPKDFKMPKETIPDRYNKNTDLLRTVGASGNDFNFEIDTKAK